MKLNAALLLGLFIVTGCGHIENEIDGTSARRIARPAFMVERNIPTPTYTLNAWERAHTRGTPANIYIGEGGGTPYHALALHLASRDQTDNVIWIAQPCQFTHPSEDCKPGAPGDDDTLAAYNEALDDIRARYDITELNLIGYDSGAAIAAYLAAMRSDVASLRTVAGALAPAHSIAPGLQTTPQMHFIGAADDVVPPATYHAFRQEVGRSACIRYAMIPDADHRKGWVETWPKLLKMKPSCGAEAPAPGDVPALIPPYNPYAKENYTGPASANPSNAYRK